MTLVRRGDHAPVRVVADSDQIKQALLNVVSNALEAMPQGGRLELELIDEERFGGFAIADSGGGIAQEDQGRIFDLFFSRRAGGSGIGLAIIKRIVDLHEGRVELESCVGEGTTVRLRLPRDEEARA